MTKEELTALLRSVGCNENTVAAMENAFEMGAEDERKKRKDTETFGFDAGVYVWLGESKVTKFVSKQEILSEEISGMALTNAAQECLAILYSNKTGKV